MPTTFPFYNLGAPTPTTKNSINNIAGTASEGGIRDFLLHRNLFPNQQSPIYQQLSTTINGSPKIGQPVLDTSVNNDVNGIPSFYPIETYGITWKNLNNVTLNQFQNPDAISVDQLTDIVDIIPKTPALGQIYNFGNVEFPQGANSIAYPKSPDGTIDSYGLLAKTTYAKFKDLSTIKNLYNVTNQQIDISDYIDDPKAVTDYFAANKNVVQGEGYLDQYGALNQGGSAGMEAANVIGSIANGGLGVSNTGLVTNFDLRSSLAGRILGATGTIKDTNIGIIGGQQLALALANNAAFNVQQEILGKLNLQDNVLGLIKGGDSVSFRPNYQITVPSSGVGKFFEGAASILGFTLPKSFIGVEGSIFASENGNVENIKRANSLLTNTGKGQFVSLIKNALASLDGTTEYDSPKTQTFRSGYAPGYAVGENESEIRGDNIYAFSNGNGHLINILLSSDSIIPDITINRTQKVISSGFESPEEIDFIGHTSNTPYDYKTVSTVGFSWGSVEGKRVNTDPEGNYSPVKGDKKSLLVKTQSLFNSVGMKNIITRKGDMGHKSSQIQQANGGGISKGSAVLQSGMFDLKNGIYQPKDASAEDTYCRSWTTINRYDSVNKMIRHKGLSDVYPYKTVAGTNGSVLDDNGFVKIAPYNSDSKTDPKKFMFSLENLAWNDEYMNLLPCERGPGDLTTGKKGRIMWFPPYDIQFSESTSVNWENNNFIGRGESVYTYNNTERSGSLSFKIIVDHSSYTNSFKGPNGPDDNFVASFMAGCIDPDSEWADKLTISEKNDIVKEMTVPQAKVVDAETPPPEFSVYFPNDNANIPTNYENGLSGSTSSDTIDYSVNETGEGFGLGSYKSDFTPGLTNDGVGDDTWPDKYNYGLNSKVSGSQGIPYSINGVEASFSDVTINSEVAKYLKEKCNSCVVKVTGYASAQGNATYNQKLANARRDAMITALKADLHTSFQGNDKEVRFKAMPSKEITGSGCKVCPQSMPIAERMIKCPPDSLDCKKDRKVVITFEPDSNLAPKDIVTPEPVETGRLRSISTKISNRLYRECDYFEKLNQTDSFVFDRFRDKIKYFHPAFHSTTPEGLNSRLTFLNQCTRQGSTLESEDANNLAFGRPPVCILRIGDFYNTKIVIESMSIDYEPLVWDLNPEGIGVQPMIANVSISFKFIGGSSLLGPINKLQNALSFNYYANTQVYDPRADYVAKRPPEAQKQTVEIKQDGSGVGSVGGEGKVGTVQVTALRPYYLADGYKGAMEDLVTSTVTPGDIVENTPLKDQEKGNTLATTGKQEEPLPIPSTTNPKVSGIGAIIVGNWDGDKHDIRVNLTFDGLTIDTSDTDLNAFIGKGLKIRIESVVGVLITEEMVVLDTPSYKGIKQLINGGSNSPLGFYFGSIIESDSDFPKINISSGTYMVKVFYDNQSLYKKLFTV